MFLKEGDFYVIRTIETSVISLSIVTLCALGFDLKIERSMGYESASRDGSIGTGIYRTVVNIKISIPAEQLDKVKNIDNLLGVKA